MKQNHLPWGLCSVGTSEEIFPLNSLGEADTPHLSLSGGLTLPGLAKGPLYPLHTKICSSDPVSAAAIKYLPENTK